MPHTSKQPSLEAGGSTRTGTRALFAKSRWVVVACGLSLEICGVRMQLQRPSDENGLLLRTVGIREATFDRTYCLASLVVVEANALGAELWVDNVQVVTFRDRLVWAFGFTSSAIDAVLRYIGRHGTFRRSDAAFAGRRAGACNRPPR